MIRMASKMNINSTLPLPKSSIQIPRLGFGVYQSPANVCERSCLTALEAGYRHIDSAQYYANEREVGQAVKKSGIKRSEIFITTKILAAGGSVDASYKKCVDSVNKIDPDGYVDLFLIHSPNAGSKARKEMWSALLKLYDEGKAKAIGVSNFGINHIKELEGMGSVWPPHVNQVEVSSSLAVPTAISDICIAAPVVPTTRLCQILSRAGHRRRGVLSAGQKLQS